jgi:hypothetical protein
MVRKFTLKKSEFIKKSGKRKYNKSKSSRKTQKKIHKVKSIKKGGKPPCQGMLEVKPEQIIEKLVCCMNNGRRGLYGRVVQRLINSERGITKGGNNYGLTATDVIKHTYDEYKNKNLDMDVQLKIRGAFVTFQEEAIKTYNLEHVLGENKYNSELLPRDW